nr:systemin receptor SR160-like [Ziziphus jujuba var. spinosa]
MACSFPHFSSILQLFLLLQATTFVFCSGFDNSEVQWQRRMKDKHFLSPSKVLKKFEECFLLGEEIKIVVDGKGIQCSKIAASLSYLNLSGNQIPSMIFPWLLRHVNGLVFLDLSGNDLRRSPHDLVKATSLVYLDLSFNHLEGMIPETLENRQSSKILDLSNNNLSGELFDGLAKLTSLKMLPLSNDRIAFEQ